MLEIAHLLLIADEYKRATGLEDVTVSHRVFGDSKKLSALRGESDITVGRFNTAVAWFAANWPDGAIWPDGVPITAHIFDALAPPKTGVNAA